VLAAALHGLRTLHGGRPGDYVAWTSAGAATLAAILAITLT